jgi:hypothetical protein
MWLAKDNIPITPAAWGLRVVISTSFDTHLSAGRVGFVVASVKRLF